MRARGSHQRELTTACDLLCAEVDTAAKRKLEEQLKELEIKFANLQALKCSETEALKNEVKAVQASSAMRVSAAVADQLKESAESRAAAFREGMAYALSTFKEMHAMHKNVMSPQSLWAVCVRA